MRLLYIIFFILFAGVAFAQNKEQTLADVRQDLTILYIEMLKLKRELSTTGAASPQVITSGSSLARLEAIEIELQRLIAQTEELQYQVDRVVRDGTSRIENLEFRLVELEGGENNLYRDSYGCFDNLENIQDPVSIKIKWFNKNRVPNPGYWSTNRKTAWGGVALDLFPHLYCHMVRLFGSMEDFERANHLMMQKWSLEDLQGSDYGAVSEDGVYNVCDFATENWLVQGKTLLEVSASWKEGYDNQSIEVQTIDSTFKWDFGLCPNDAYGKMIVAAETEDYDKHKAMDTWIHKNLEVYHEG